MYNQDPFLANLNNEIARVQQAYNQELQKITQAMNSYRQQPQYGQMPQQNFQQPMQQPVVPPVQQTEQQPDTTNIQMLGALGEIKSVLEKMNRHFVDFKNILDPQIDSKPNKKKSDETS